MEWGRIYGVYPPIVTPLTAKEELDVSGLERQIERLIAAGVHGIYLLGTSGEGTTLRDPVRWQTVEEALRIVNGRVPLLACVSDTSTERVLENARRVRELGLSAIAVTPPYYYPAFDAREHRAFFERVAGESGLAVFIYNIPATTKEMLSAELIAQLAEVENITGIKDSTGNWVHTVELLDRVRDREGFAVFIGSHVLAGPAILYGADGGVMSLANLDPVTCVRLYEAAVRRDLETLAECTFRLTRLGQIYKVAAQVPSLKTVLHWMGVCEPHVTHPLQLPDAEQSARLRKIVEELGLLEGVRQ
ncbi:MAG: dihydrodipicolinate synthase family protein [Candidatus Poribacteria bacterium]|nr:MAG: dihydrodipicolinate synthase family protein [Candidatus Poribacteria bacterium]